MPEAYGDFDAYKVDDTRLDTVKMHKFLCKQIGKKYDYSSVLRFISRRQACRDDSGKWFCSELVFAASQKAGLNLLERIEPWAVSPGSLSLSPYLIPTTI